MWRDNDGLCISIFVIENVRLRKYPQSEKKYMISGTPWIPNGRKI